ncbi:hypothetical protein QVD17_24925 [Tagetes erecta]|uniref:Uncharacterized protein n=1 Tax=Tagetes erecta TaxID=13708 RepID=A0AAD8KIK3_TARER|nr:hypothetical protein QVD17_24925 [Tagetes erecta]
MGDCDSSHVHAPLPPTAKKSNKIRDIVRLQQMLKKWKKAATATKNNNNNNNHNNNNHNSDVAAPITVNNNNNSNSKTSTKGLNKFLKKTLSFSDISSQGEEVDVVKKGYLAVWVGRDDQDGMKKFVIPTDYLAHQAFSVLLRDAEEEFGFQQEGILKIPCDVPLFEEILRMLSDNNNKKQNQRPTLKSSSSTSSFFLHEQDHQPPPPPPESLLNQCSSPLHQHGRRSNNNSTTFDSQLKTPPTTPTHHLPLYCR